MSQYLCFCKVIWEIIVHHWWRFIDVHLLSLLCTSKSLFSNCSDFWSIFLLDRKSELMNVKIKLLYLSRLSCWILIQYCSWFDFIFLKFSNFIKFVSNAIDVTVDCSKVSQLFSPRVPQDSRRRIESGALRWLEIIGVGCVRLLKCSFYKAICLQMLTIYHSNS